MAVTLESVDTTLPFPFLVRLVRKEGKHFSLKLFSCHPLPTLGLLKVMSPDQEHHDPVGTC